MAEGGGLENRYTLSGIGGSNPPLSAIFIIPSKCKSFTVSYSDVENMQNH